jgi:hypothetical protein
MRASLRVIGSVITCLSTFAGGLLGATITLPELMNLTTAIEASTSGLTTIVDSQGAGLSQLSWSGTFSDSGWTYSGFGVLAGKAVNLVYTGALTGSQGANITVTFSGTGSLGSDPLLMGGMTTWVFDPSLNDYAAMDFEQLTKIGSGSLWGWIVGAETVGGGVIGGAAGLAGGVVATAATGGLGVGAGVALTAGGALGGAAAGVGISAGVKSLLGPSPPPKPSASARPVFPGTPTPLLATPGMIYTAVSVGGNLAGSDLNGNIISSGSFDVTSGRFNGSSTTIPEPPTFATIAVGLWALAYVLRRFEPKTTQ